MKSERLRGVTRICQQVNVVTASLMQGWADNPPSFFDSQGWGDFLVQLDWEIRRRSSQRCLGSESHQLRGQIVSRKQSKERACER